MQRIEFLSKLFSPRPDITPEEFLLLTIMLFILAVMFSIIITQKEKEK